MARFANNEPETPEHFSRSYSAAHYTDERRKRSTASVVRNVIIVVSVLVIAGVAAAFAYIGSIQSKLSGSLPQQLHEELAVSEPGRPFYMLLLGVDRGEGREYMDDYGMDDSAYRTDTILLTRVDPPNKKVTLVSIHRDTAVLMGEHGKQKINAAYSFGGEAYETQVVSQFAGVPISHYADVDFYGMCAIVDYLGGIEVNVPVDVIDDVYTHAHILAGVQTVNGEQALQLCRARHAYDAYGDGDLYRAANQRMVIAAILKKVLAQDPITMVNTISQLAESVNTDLDLPTLLDLANQFRGMDPNTDIMSGMNPTESEYVDDIWWEISDNKAWQAMMQRVNNGLPPYENAEDDSTRGVAGSVDSVPEQGAATPAEPGAAPAMDYSGSVLVLNGSGTSGVAGGVADTLSARGFAAEADTAANLHDSTSVVYAPGADAKARAVAEVIGGNPALLEDNGSYDVPGDVMVILGMDRG